MTEGPSGDSGSRLRNPEEIHLPIVEPRHRQHVTLRIDADVGGGRDVAHQLRQLAVLHDVHRAVGPARDENAAVTQHLDAVVLARTVGYSRRLLVALLPRLHALRGEAAEDEARVRLV